MAIKFDFGALKETVTGLAQSGMAQGRKVATIAKLKSDNLAQQDTLRKAYLAIGKLYYAECQGEAGEAYAELFAKVEAALAAIAANNAALEELKEADEVVIDVDVDVEMQAGEMPEGVTLEDLVVEEAPVEEAPAEEAPVEEVPTEEKPEE